MYMYSILMRNTTVHCILLSFSVLAFAGRPILSWKILVRIKDLTEPPKNESLVRYPKEKGLHMATPLNLFFCAILSTTINLRVFINYAQDFRTSANGHGVYGADQILEKIMNIDTSSLLKYDALEQ